MAAASPAELTLCPHPPPPSIHALEAVPVGSADGPVHRIVQGNFYDRPAEVVHGPPGPLALVVSHQAPTANAVWDPPSSIEPNPWSAVVTQDRIPEPSALEHPLLGPTTVGLPPEQVVPKPPLTGPEPWGVASPADADTSAANGTMAALDPCEGVTGALTVPLMEHQKQGVRWMTAMEKSHHRGGILADDMGLGKTVQALALIAAHPAQHINRHATLVVTPASLIQHECTCTMGIAEGKPHPPVLNGYDIVLTMFGTITAELRRTGPRQHARNLAGPHRSSPLFGPASGWHRVILDEAQCIKNDQSQTAAACCALDATYRWCLSGTPVMNNLRELYSLLKFLRVQPYASRQSFATVGPAEDRALSSGLSTAVADSRESPASGGHRPAPKVDGYDHAAADQDVHHPGSAHPATARPNHGDRVRDLHRAGARAIYRPGMPHAAAVNHYLSGGNPSRNVSHMLGLLQRLWQACCHPFLVSDFIPDTLDASGNNGHRAANAICRVVIDPSKATDHTAFAKQHYPTPPGDVNTESLSTALENLRGRVEDDRDDGQDLMLGMPAEADHAYPPVQFHMNPTPTIHAPKRSFARLRQRALTSPAAKQKYQQILAETWISSSKIDRALEIVRDIVARGEPGGEREKVVIFSQFTSMLDLIEVPLARHGWAFRRYDGTMKPADRHAATVHFATDPDCLILLVSMKAGNSGLNLTAVSQVIILDPFWNPYVEDQAVGRVHRIGQRRPVHVHRILVSNTVEDRILDFQERKRQLIEGIVDHRTHGEPSRLESTDFAYLFVSS
ncbi:hypothetical protein G4B11_000212 [Aspergillus flavus]|nr:hypothetical protein G4B11_000212 [Aspergillus flavus]